MLRQMLHHEGTKDTKVTKAHKASALALSHEIVGAAIEVHRFTGPGLLESIYEGALCRELTLRNIAFERQVGLPVHYKGQLLDYSVKLDLLVEKTVIVEVKAVGQAHHRPQSTAPDILETSKSLAGPSYQFQRRDASGWPASGFERFMFFFVSFVPSW